MTWLTPARARLMPDDVHVWRAPLDIGAAELTRRTAVLDAVERERAARFRSEEARTRYIAGRGLLREILGRYLETAPSRLTFQQNAYGKPALGGEFASADLRFNVSRSGASALYAVARAREVGVDLEECVTRFATGRIAGHFFSKLERAAILALPASRQTRAFFATWTRKEAFIKARGEGLSLLDQFSVDTDPDRSPRLIEADRPGELERWSMASLPVASPYEAALVAEGSDWRVTCWDCWTISQGG